MLNETRLAASEGGRFIRLQAHARIADGPSSPALATTDQQWAVVGKQAQLAAHGYGSGSVLTVLRAGQVRPLRRRACDEATHNDAVTARHRAEVYPEVYSVWLHGNANSCWRGSDQSHCVLQVLPT